MCKFLSVFETLNFGKLKMKTKKIIAGSNYGLGKRIIEIQRKEIKASEPISGESLELEVAMPKFALGLRGEDQLSSDSKTLFKYKLANQLFLDLLFGNNGNIFIHIIMRDRQKTTLEIYSFYIIFLILRHCTDAQATA